MDLNLNLDVSDLRRIVDVGGRLHVRFGDVERVLLKLSFLSGVAPKELERALKAGDLRINGMTVSVEAF